VAGRHRVPHLIVKGAPRPKYAWTFEKDGSIRVVCETEPREALLWQATNAKSRDFRFPVIGKARASRPLAAEGGTYVGSIDPPKEGWTAFFVELTFDGGFKVTSGVRVLPDTLPFKDLDPAKAPLETLK
jgi:PhoPQ-activated pathogenicity-related protein